MKSIKRTVIAIIMLLGFAPMLLSPPAFASSIFDEACSGDAADTALCKDAEANNAADYIRTLVNLLLYGLGAVSVVMIIFAGIFYTTSMGEPGIIKKAKDTLLYAVIGLVVALSAYAIVNFILLNTTTQI